MRLARAARVLGLAGAIAVALRIDWSIVAAVVTLFVLVVPFEKLYPRQRGQRLRRPMVGTDLSFALLSPLLNVVGIIALSGLPGRTRRSVRGRPADPRAVLPRERLRPVAASRPRRGEPGVPSLASLE